MASVLAIAAISASTRFSAGATRSEDSQSKKLVMEEFMIPASDAGIEIYARNKYSTGMTTFTPERTLLFVHGSTSPAHTTFDLPLGGLSWMDYIASRGFDAYLLDVRGYGKSSRPKEMSDKPDANAPIVRTATAVKDVGSVVDFILKRRNIARLDLLGWSWGAGVMATYATQNPDKVERLVLYAPSWIRTTAPLIQTGPGPTPAYRSVSKDQARDRWLNGVPEEKKADLIPTGWFDQWANATWATDPEGSKMIPPVLRVPNGTIADTTEFWAAGKNYYDPSEINAPTLIVGAEWDRDNPAYMRQSLFPLLVNSHRKQYLELAEGTHTIMMEKNRLALFQAVQAFIN